MAYANTVETVGDATLTNSIIDKSITELHDDIIVTIGRGIFQDCTALTNVDFKSATFIDGDAFSGCTSLKKAEFHSTVTKIDSSAFYDCTSLEALILRGQRGEVVSGAFGGSAIQAGTGYIYVPAALVDAYKSHATWDDFATQIRAIEDYPEVCDPYSWDVVFKNIAAGTYASVYKVGDTVPLDLGSEGIINMQIVAFDTDNLADGSGKAHITWVAKELLKTERRMNPALVTNADGTYQECTGTIGGWEKCEMRAYLKETIKPMIPETVRNAIKEVAKRHYSNETNGELIEQTTMDDVWIPSRIRDDGYDYSEIKSLDGNVSVWWLRDPGNKGNFYCVSTSGNMNSSDYAQYSKGVCLCFCT